MHAIQIRTGAARRLAIQLGVLSMMVFTVHPADAQMNQDVMMKWMDAKVVHYSVVGDFEGEDMVVQAGTNGYARVKDHVEIGFDYDITQAKLVGAAVFKNFPTEMGALRNGADRCRAPTIAGNYEHATIESLKDGQGGQLQMVVRTEFPTAQMTVACTGGNQAVAAHVKSDHVDFIVPGIMMLAMGDAMTGELTVSKDHKSFIVKKVGWTYVYTPTKVK
jgi:hypothetical protein